MRLEIGDKVILPTCYTHGYTIQNAYVARVVIPAGKRKKFPTGLYQVNYEIQNGAGEFRQRSQPFQGWELTKVND